MVGQIAAFSIPHLLTFRDKPGTGGHRHPRDDHGLGYHGVQLTANGDPILSELKFPIAPASVTAVLAKAW
jgi:hypothetical protein